MKIKYSPIVTVVQGCTGKDHLLGEIASKVHGSLKSAYASRASAKKAAERAIYGVVATRELYRGCAAGLRPDAKEVQP